MRVSRKVILGGALVLAIAGLGLGQAALEADAAQQTVEAPRFEVDPFWPKPLPNGWVLGLTIGVAVDSRDHVYIIHRNNQLTPATELGADSSRAECCRQAPPIMEFDPQGNLVKAWGGPVEGAPYTWPESNHGIAVDRFDNVWIGGNGGTDSHILKFTRDGRFLAQYGQPNLGGVDSKSRDRFAGVAKLIVDEGANEVYLADGYRNRRVAVLDQNTGAMKRMWGAYGKEPVDVTAGDYTDGRGTDPAWSADKAPAPWFRTPVHCADPSTDGFVYVCDRQNNRLQVFRKDGTYVKEAFYAPTSLGDGATWDVSFSRDPQQKYIYLADGKNDRVWIIDRQTLAPLTTFGSGGRYPGQFQAVHSIVTDSQGNIYTTETYEGRRVQKFVYKGLARVTRMHQGTPWPGLGGN
jgi:DNA-binding beta-propeller fold protein YncE